MHEGSSVDGGAGGWFGVWGVDRDGLDCFDVDLTPWRRGRVPLVVPERGYDDCWHQVASRDLTATAHIGGWTTLWEGRRGLVRLTGRDSWWGDPGDPVGGGPGHRPDALRWGPGYAEWRARSGGATITRRVTAPLDVGPVLRVDVRVEREPVGRPGRARLDSTPAADSAADSTPTESEVHRTPGGRHAEAWVPRALPLVVGALMSPVTPPPPGSTWPDALAWRLLFRTSAVSRSLTWAARAALAPALQRDPRSQPALQAVVTPARWPRRRTAPQTPAWVDLHLPDVAVALVAASLEGGGRTGLVEVSTEGPALVVTWPEAVTLAELVFAVALVDDDHSLPTAVAAVAACAPPETARRHQALWPAAALPAAPAPTAGLPAADLAALAAHPAAHPTLAREARWHTSALVGAAQPDDAFGFRYPSQGSAYGYVHGLQGAPRDYAISAVPLAVVDPPAAADALRTIMAMTSRDGTIHYAHTGRGRVTSGGIHAAPTDLPLFFMWALTEYLDATGDVSFLDVPVPYLSRAAARRPGGTATPRERMVQAIATVAERVGTGPHGLLRVGSGDWADPISAMVPDRAAFHRDGESGFNTAMACHVLPRAAAVIATHAPEVAADARALTERLRAAMAQAWAGQWFLRGWDGRGGPVGAHHLFLDGQVWALVARIGTEEQRGVLVEAIRARCLDPSPIGPTILDRPHAVRFGMLAPGWDCNGGVWAAIGALAAWGLAGHDPTLAWRCLEAQSLAAHARAYPHVWFGIWSGPDAYNAHFGPRPGETFIQPATPMQEYPVMNSNAHAGPLLGLLKVLADTAAPVAGLAP